jgi:hypothetical protein
MTAHTPAPKASGVSALPASFFSVAPPPQPPVKDDFVTVMLQALIAGPDGADHSPAAQPAQQKPSPKEAAAPDPTAARLLLALLSSPLPTLFKLASRKAGESPSQPAAPDAPEKHSSAEAATDPTVAGLLLALLAAPLPTLPKALSHKSSIPSTPVKPSILGAPPAAVQTAGEGKPDKTDEAEKTPPLLAQVTPTKESEGKPTPTSGTSVAITNSRMSFPSERNEIAGRMEQKLPLAAVSAVSSGDTGGPSSDGEAKSSLTFSWHEAPSESLTIVDLTGKAAASVVPVTTLADTSVDAPVRASSTAPLERLEQMISREVVNVRSAGAESLGVTLKLDPNTQLYLQLTTHNGLVQASVRCERGVFAPEDAQWTQLQQSLARQNVELLPMTGGSSLNFQQHPEEPPRQPDRREDWPTATATAPPAQPRKQPQQQQNRSRKNWESWA